MIDIAVEVASEAPPHAVFRLLRDGATWPRWSLFEAFELEREGREDPLGAGSIRVFSTRVSRAREQVVEIVEGRRLGYVLLSGFPLQDYRAEVDLLRRKPVGTIIRWRSSFRTKYFGTGWFWRLFLHKAIGDVARQLARAAEDSTLVDTSAPLWRPVSRAAAGASVPAEPEESSRRSRRSGSDRAPSDNHSHKR